MSGKKGTRVPFAAVSIAAAIGATSCESDAPRSEDAGLDHADADAVPDLLGDLPDAIEADPEADAEASPDADADDDGGNVCEPATTDYLPRVDGSAGDDWPACVSDDNAYHPIETTIGSIARVAAFEQIADLLWRRAGPPSPADFTNARVIYVDPNGLDSRVQRREDLHYPPVPAAEGACTERGVPERFPERCAGPGRILPILNDAFVRGTAGTDPLVQAARIEAALLWFLYLSPYKEAHTCTDTPRDCDSAWAYYTGGEDRSGGLGLAAYVRALDAETHDRVWDGLLAVRCWKNLDNEAGVSTDLAMRDRAIAQMDRAALRGVALIVRDRLDDLAAAAGDAERRAHAAFAGILGAVLDREATARDPVAAAVLRTELGRSDPATIDLEAAKEAIDALFPCP